VLFGRQVKWWDVCADEVARTEIDDLWINGLRYDIQAKKEEEYKQRLGGSAA
jgi:hypothetical protein